MCARRSRSSAQIIGNFLARHRQLDRVSRRSALRHSYEKARDALLRALHQQKDLFLHAPQFAGGEGEQFTTDRGITTRQRCQHAALDHEDFRIGYRLGRKGVLIVELQPEEVAGQIKPAIWRRPSLRIL